MATPFGLQGCSKNCEYTHHGQFKDIFQSEILNTAESWWLIGESDDFYMIEKRTPLNSQCYIVNKEEVYLPYAFANDEINIKNTDIKWH